MFDNFVEENYHPADLVYTHPQANHHLFIGDAQAALDLAFLTTNSIATVVTAARDMDHISYDSSINHIVYPLLDAKHEDIALFFNNFYEIVEANIQKGSILVHCAAGISRSSTLVISYIMKQERLGFKEAIALVRKGRPSVLPNLGFERQLKRYEEELRAGRAREERRREVKESGKSQLLFRTELVPLQGAQKLKEKLMSANVRNLVEKITEKDLQVIRTYNRSRNDKNKKFMISKKSASFTKHYDDLKHALVLSAPHHPRPPAGHDPRTDPRTPAGHDPRSAKTPLDEMKDIYLARRNQNPLERRFPTDRGHTFYNARGRKPENP